MKSVFLTITSLVFFAILCKASFSTDGESLGTVKTTNEGVNGKVQKVNNKLYFNIRINQNSEKGFYVLLKYLDEKNSIPISVKEAITSNSEVPILYSFVDNNIPLSDTHYEIVKISERGKNLILNYDYTSEATVSSEEH